MSKSLFSIGLGFWRRASWAFPTSFRWREGASSLLVDREWEIDESKTGRSISINSALGSEALEEGPPWAVFLLVLMIKVYWRHGMGSQEEFSPSSQAIATSWKSTSTAFPLLSTGRWIGTCQATRAPPPAMPRGTPTSYMNGRIICHVSIIRPCSMPRVAIPQVISLSSPSRSTSASPPSTANYQPGPMLLSNELSIAKQGSVFRSILMSSISIQF